MGLFPSKDGIWTGTNTQKNIFLEFFSSISWGLCTGTKGEKVVIFGAKTEKLKFYSSNILKSSLVPVLNPKSTNFQF
jgi:hypothetical protein